MTWVQAVMATLLIASVAHADSPPVSDEQPHPTMDMGSSVRGMLLVDRLEVQIPELPATLLLDAEGWLGGGLDRLRYRLEGEFSFADLDGDTELAVSYARLVERFWEVQLGVRALGQLDSEQRLSGEVAGMVGLEGVVPYEFDLEAGLFVSHTGRVTLEVAVVKELLLTQRLVLQLRAETDIASADAPALGTRAGFVRANLAARLRLETAREVAPYVGIVWDAASSPPDATFTINHVARGVAGLRFWF